MNLSISFIILTLTKRCGNISISLFDHKVRTLSFVKRYRYLLAGSSGILLFCSFPTLNFFPLAWVALIPLLIALEAGASRKSSFLMGYISGLVFFAGLLLAIVLLYPYANIPTTLLGYSLLVGYTALYFAVFAVLVHILPWRTGLLYPIAVASIWVSLEWIKGWLLTGFPWGNIGYSQWNFVQGIQIASITGVYGISFIVVFFNAGIAKLICNIDRWRDQLITVIVPCLLTIVCITYGFVVIDRHDNTENSLKVALVPGNISQLEKWQRKNFPRIFAKYLNLSRKAASKKPDIIVWPETAVSGDVLSGKLPNYNKHFKDFQAQIGNIPMLIGATDLDAYNDLYNRVISVSSNSEIVGKYAKMHLVPFGEYIPLADFLPNFIQFQPYQHGKTLDTLPIVNAQQSKDDNLKVGTSICFESAFPNHFRKFVKQGADVMGILTNDAWFTGTAFPELHLAMAPMRAVENRIAVFRCANGGYTCVVDKYGRINRPMVTPQTSEEFINAEINLKNENLTLYTRYGDWFPILCILSSIVSLTAVRIFGLISSITKSTKS